MTCFDAVVHSTDLGMHPRRVESWYALPPTVMPIMVLDSTLIEACCQTLNERTSSELTLDSIGHRYLLGLQYVARFVLLSGKRMTGTFCSG